MDLIIGVNKGSIINVPKNDAEEVRPVDGDIHFEVNNPGIVTLFSEDGGKTVQVVPVSEGQVIYTATADADLAPGSVKLINSNPVTINVAPKPIQEATHIESTEGPVVPQ